MIAYFTRDSVCAGDDGDAPHPCEIDLPADLDVEALVQFIWRNARLPSISGGAATWCLASKIPLAVGAQQWAEPKMLSLIAPALAELDVRGDIVRLHFSYLAQRDPQTVIDVLKRLRLTAELADRLPEMQITKL